MAAHFPNRDLLFREQDFVFSCRATGILIHDGYVLLQKPDNDDYAFPGGHVIAGETCEETLVREYQEEIHAQVIPEQLLAVGEVFFPWGNKPCHQIGLYYRLRLADDAAIPRAGSFTGWNEDGSPRPEITFTWVPLAELPSLTIYPEELIPYLMVPAQGVVHFVTRDLPEE